MASIPEKNRDNKVALEDALRTYPIIPAPAGFSGKVMDSVRAASPKPVFRLSWIDYALTFFVASMSGLALFFVQRLPINWIMLARFRIIVLWERSSHIPFSAYLMVGYTLVILVIATSSVLFARPQMMINPGRLSKTSR